MTELVLSAAGLVAAAAVLLGAAVLAATRQLSPATGVTLELLLAAGLLHLAVVETWTAIATAALIVAVRQVVVAGLRVRWRTGSRDGT